MVQNDSKSLLPRISPWPSFHYRFNEQTWAPQISFRPPWQEGDMGLASKNHTLPVCHSLNNISSGHGKGYRHSARKQLGINNVGIDWRALLSIMYVHLCRPNPSVHLSDWENHLWTTDSSASAPTIQEKMFHTHSPGCSNQTVWTWCGNCSARVLPFDVQSITLKRRHKTSHLQDVCP